MHHTIRQRLRRSAAIAIGLGVLLASLIPAVAQTDRTAALELPKSLSVPNEFLPLAQDLYAARSPKPEAPKSTSTTRPPTTTTGPTPTTVAPTFSSASVFQHGANDPLRVITEGTTQSITAEQAVLLALDNNQYLNVLRFRQPLWETRIQEALAPFDPVVELGQIFEERDAPLTSNITTAGTTATRQLSQTLSPPPQQNDNISYSRRTSDGSVVQLNYNNRYERLIPAGDFRIVNPAWNTGISLAVRKPLLRGAGVPANYAKANINEQYYQRAGFDVRQAMNYLARTVRRAYWDLDLAYRQLDIQSRARKWAKETYVREEKRFQIGSGTRADVAQSKELFQRFRIMELEAKTTLLEQERKFRWMMGLHEYNDNIFATELNSQPIMAVVDWNTALAQALSLRPDLAAQRHHIEAYRHEVGLRENETLPDFALLGRVSVSGLDNQLAASVSDTFSAEGTSWMAGLVYRRPVNNVLSQSLLRRALLNVAQQQAVLEQLQHNATHDLRQAYIAVAATQQRRQLQQSRVAAASERLEASEKQYRTRKMGQVDYLLRAQEALTAAELARARALIEERKAVEQWNYERGAILCDGAFEEVAGPAGNTIQRQIGAVQPDRAKF